MNAPDTSHDSYIEEEEERQEQRAATSFDDMAPPRWMLYLSSRGSIVVRFLAPDEALLKEHFSYFAGAAGSAIARQLEQGSGRVWLGNWLVAIDTVVPLDGDEAPPLSVNADNLTPAFSVDDGSAVAAALEQLTDAVATASDKPDHVRTAWSGLIAAVSQFVSSFPAQFTPTAIQNLRRAVSIHGGDVDPQYTSELLSSIAALHEEQALQGAVKDTFVDILSTDRLHPAAANHALSLFVDTMDDVHSDALNDIVAQHEILLGLSRYRNQIPNDEYELYVHRLNRLEERA